MDELAVGQRWISETEPELGLGTLMAFDNRTVDIKFVTSGSIRKYSIRNAPLKRVIFKVGDKITDNQNNIFNIEKVEEENSLLVYISKDLKVKETDVSDNIGFTGAEDRLITGQTDENKIFDLRYRTLLMQNEYKKSDVRGFTGARVELLPHQLYIAQEVTKRDFPRVMLADEVGLGKTIEAGLIIHNLLNNERINRVLIVTPESLVNQWFVEMLRKFNISFNILDEEHCKELEESMSEDSNPFQEYQLVITSIDFLAKSPWHENQVVENNWDLLVVDEAHHLIWSPQKVSHEYEIIEELALISKGVLLLTATPEQMGIQSHFARLRLLDPDRFYDLEAFTMEVQDYEDVAQIASKIISDKDLSDSDLDIMSEYVTDTKVLANIKKNKKDILQSLIDQHGTGRVLFRNTRLAMHDFPKRILKSYPLKKQEINRDKWWKNDLRIETIAQILTDLKGEKVLLICKNKQTTLEIDEAIKEKISIKTALFHEGLSLIARDRNAAYFREKDGADILISSEIGSEGRNFQFSHNIILFDLPANPDLLEQRIGRLDRIGQKYDISIHVPFILNTEQNILFDLYHSGLNAFEEHIKGANLVLANFKVEIKDLLEDTENYDSKKNTELINKIADYRKVINSELENGKDKLLEINSFNPDIGNQMVEKIKDKDQSPDLDEYMEDLFEHFGINYEDLDDRVYKVTPSDNMFVETFPGLSADGVTVTYDRKTALEREDYKFLTFENPMVTGAIDMLLSSEKGNAVVGKIISDKNYLIMETIFVLECISKSELQADRFLPPTPIRVTINGDLKEENINYDFVNKNIIETRPEVVFEKNGLSQEKITLMIQKSNEFAGYKAIDIIKKSQKDMIDLLAYEAKRLIDLKLINPNVSDDEIEFAKDRIKALNKAIEKSRLRLDSIRIIEVEKKFIK